MKNNVNNMLTVCFILFVIGIVIIFNAANIGESIGNTTAFQLIGLICSLISGIGILLFCFYKAIKLDHIDIENKKTP